MKKDPVLHIPANFHEDDELNVLKNSDDVEKLRSVLRDGEVVYRLALGFHDGSDGVLAATSKRILFADQRFLSSHVQSFEYDSVAAIAYKKELVTVTLTLLTSDSGYTITKLENEHAERFLEFIGETIGQDYTVEAKGRVFKHNDELIELGDMPSMQEDLESSETK